MDKPDRTMSDERKPGIADLARRLERYRRRVEAEGRQRSLRVIDRAIEDVEDHAGRVRLRARMPSGGQRISDATGLRNITDRGVEERILHAPQQRSLAAARVKGVEHDCPLHQPLGSSSAQRAFGPRSLWLHQAASLDR